MNYLVLLGRILYSLIFLEAILSNFSASSIAKAADKGMPMSNILVPGAGIMAFVGGLSIVLGYKAKLGAWLIILFLVPVTLMMHNFWTIKDPMMRRMQQLMFMKNLSMLGAALLIAYFGAGPLSIDSND